MRLLVLANETCASGAVRSAVADMATTHGTPSDVLVVSPCLSRSRFSHWMSASVVPDRAVAEARLDQSVAALCADGLPARGELGDADPLQALDDAVRVYHPDRIIIATHTPERSQWLERNVVVAASARFDEPITHVVVDLDAEAAVAGGGATAVPTK